MIRRFSILLWFLLRSVPPASTGRLLMPMVFLSGWNVLRFAGASGADAFVWSAVLSQALQLWAVLPQTTAQARHRFGPARLSYIAVLSVMLLVVATQVWICDPLYSQRLLTVLCMVYALVMVLGLAGDRTVLDSFAPADPRAPQADAARFSLLRLFAFVAFIVMTVNEGLILLDVPLAARVATLALLPILLNVGFEMVCRRMRAQGAEKAEEPPLVRGA